jgi:uncharacterized coiled-coil DUF342 family protein
MDNQSEKKPVIKIMTDVNTILKELLQEVSELKNEVSEIKEQINETEFQKVEKAEKSGWFF